MSSKESLSLLNVMENLTAIVDATTLDTMEVTSNHLLVPRDKEEPSFGVLAGLNEETLAAIRATIQGASIYLRAFYKKMREDSDNKNIMEGMRNIIVLVGEAKKKLERFDRLFGETISELPEYQEIQKFYSERIVTDISQELDVPIFASPEHIAISDEEWQRLLDNWSREEQIEELRGVHYLNDLEVVKADHLYELFYLKNEAGYPFYTQELAKNIKLACDFMPAVDNFVDDPLVQLKSWEDKANQVLATKILAATHKLTEQFYKMALNYKEAPIVSQLHNALMALMLASNPHNLLRQNAKKGCGAYFADFQMFLHEAISHREYQKLYVHEGEAEESAFYKTLFSLANALCFHLYTQSPGKKEVTKKIREFIEKHRSIRRESVSQFLESTFLGFQEGLRYHPSGPIFKAVDLLREEQIPFFNPLHLGNIPNVEALYEGEKPLILLRMASPTKQELIKKAEIIEEFKLFLFVVGSKKEGERVLLINFQDRTSWREHARAHAIEEWSKKAEFASTVATVTFAKETDFYNQAGHYKNIEDAEDFKNQFFEHLQDETTGFYYPLFIKKELFPDFANSLIETVHHTLFQSLNHLSLTQRLDFIEITYLLLELKIVEIVQPHYLVHLSKDGLDVTATTSAALMIFLQSIQGKAWSEPMLDQLLYLLYGPTLIQRQRCVHRERFERVLSLARWLEKSGPLDKKSAHAFSKLFQKETLQMAFTFPKENE